MKPNSYDFRQFQEELAALDRKSNNQGEETSAPKGESAQARLLQAQTEFLALCKRYNLTVAHVVAFLPEEEGIECLQKLIAEQEGKTWRRPKRPRLTSP